MFNLLNGWKTILGYVGLNFVDTGLIDAIVGVVSNPSPENVGKAVAHLFITFGLIHKVVKDKR